MSQAFVLNRATSARWPRARIEAEPKFSVLFISGLIGAAIPLILALYWIGFWLAPETVAPFLRVLVAGFALLLGLVWYRAPLSHAEVLLFRVLVSAAVVWLIPALMATNRSHALGGWFKFVVLFAICCFSARGLRHPPTARAFGFALLVSSLILGVFILFVYVKYVGFTMPTYKTAREFKGIAQTNSVPLNTIPFAAVFSYFMGLCLIRPTWLLVSLGAPLVLISSFLTGSRAPLVIIGASLFVLLCGNGLRSKSIHLRIGTALIVLAALIGGIVAISMSSEADLSHATEGRSHLWSVAIAKFVERPLIGFGYESWRDDLVSRLPGEENLTFALASRLAGGYHNEYVSVLAEQGLIGLVGAALIVWLMLRSAWLLAFRNWATVHAGQWPLFACVFLLLRANFEVPGLFGYAQEPADYLAYLFMAVLLSRYSVEEDHGRALALHVARSFA